MTPPPSYSGAARPEIVTESVPAGKPGWITIATSSDHKAIGRMYIATALSFLAAALTLLVLMRIQLLIPDGTIIRPEIFDRLLSNYGVTAVLMFAVPLFLGLISFVVPLQIGSRGVALPRVGALSYWLYLIGSVSIYASFLYKPAESGTLALPPLSDDLFAVTNGVDAWATGVGLIALGFVLFAINMVATLHNQRAPGMVWRRVPLFSHAAAVISYLLLVIGPIMIAAVAMLMIDRNFDGVFFDSGDGGGPQLYEHLAWIFFTGIYMVIVIGAFGAISEIFSAFSRQPHFGHRTIAASFSAIAVLGTLAWMQNMYSAPIPIGFLYFAMAMALALAVPIGLILFNWIATLRDGAAATGPPMRFAVGAAVLAVIGLAGEWASSVIPVGWQLANTGVAWGDTHFVLVGSGVLGGFAALHYWYPKITGRFMGTSLAGASLWTVIAGTILMVVPIQLAGLAGMPVDVYKFYGDTGMSAYNLIGSLGAFLLAGGIILTLVNAAASYNGGTAAPHDPWHGSTLEWFALSPPPPHNFDLVPDVRSNEAYRDIREAVSQRSTELVLPPASAAGSKPEADAAEPVAVGAAEGETGQSAESQASGGEHDTGTAASEPETPEATDQETGADTASGENDADDGDDRPVA